MSQPIPTETRERIAAAADALYAEAGRERLPTVDAVRRAARADMAAVSAVMRDWRRAQTAQATPVAVAVPESVAQASSAALAALWQTAQELATESLRAAQTAWEAERAEADRDRQELAEAYERQAGELEEVRAAAGRAAELHQGEQAERAQELASLRAELAAALTSAGEARERAALLAGKLEASEAHSAALLARITPPAAAKATARKSPPKA